MAILDEASFGFVLDAPVGDQTGFTALVASNVYGFSASAYLGDATESGDLDSYAFRTDIGSSYTIITFDSPGLWGDDAGITSVAVNTATGDLVALTGPDSNGVQGTIFTATEETYYLTAYSDSAGFYGFRVINNSATDTEPMAVEGEPSTFTAALDYASDLDGYGITLNQGDELEINLTSDGLPIFVGIQNSLLQTVDIFLIEGSGAHQFTAPSTGLFSLQLVANDGRATGAYTLSTAIDQPTTGAVLVTGTARQDEVLTADVSGVDDADGIGSFSYQWQRNGMDIPGATAETYLLTNEDVGDQISVDVTFTDGAGNIENLSGTLSETVISNGQTITGTLGADTLEGTEGWDRLFGLDGNDLLNGLAGNDELDGGDGTDTSLHSGNQASYTLELSPGSMMLTDRRSAGDGTDQLTSIEALSFLDDDWPLAIFSGVSGLAEQAFRDFVEVYIGYFNRAPDAEGLFFYGTAFANGTSLEDSAATFLDSGEYQATYPPGLSNQEFAEAVYNNVLGRISDLLGLEFWVGVLDSGARSRDVFILEVLKGAKAPPPADATQAFINQKAADVAYLANKTDIGIYFAVTKGMSNVDNATTAMQLFDDGEQSDIDAAVAAIDGYYADALDPENGEFLLQLVGVVDDPFVV